MQNRGAIIFIAVGFALACLFQLSFTFFTAKVERNAREYANSDRVSQISMELSNGNPLLEKHYHDSISKRWENNFLDSMETETVYNILVRKYTYKECKKREINLGLDLKGGMNVTMEVSVVDIIRELATDKNDSLFNSIIKLAKEKQKNSQSGFVILFGESFNELAPGRSLASFFLSSDLKGRIDYNTSDEEVLKVIDEEASNAIDRTFKILRTRIDKFGVAQPNIQFLPQSGRILVELPGIKDPERVRELLQKSAKLEFWKTYEYEELYSYFEEADKKLAAKHSKTKVDESVDTLFETEDTTTPEMEEVIPEDTGEEQDLLGTLAGDESDTTASVLDQIGGDTTAETAAGQQTFEDFAQEHPLIAYLNPALFQNEEGQYYPNRGPVVGYALAKDTIRVNEMLNSVKEVFPRDLKLLWTIKPGDNEKLRYQLVALQATREGTAALGGEVVINARQDFSQSGGNEITMTMNSEGAKIWKRLTAEAAPDKRSIAIVLDDYVYSFPFVQSEIPNGRSSITGQFTLEEAKDLANILEAGKLPAPARIIQEAVVGPSLGKEAVSSGLISFIIAFVLVLFYMFMYYNKAGLVADLALLTNIFFLFGVLASLQAVLTLPGIAGIVLTLGMAVDANVIIYERIKEEIRNGKGIRLAISDGYKNAYSAIIDGNVTTLLTGVVLYVFGSGPVQGFATTLIIGILSSLFSAIFISRLIFTWMLNRNMNISLDNSITRKWLVGVNYDFMNFRKKAYIISAIVILVGLISLGTRGLSPGVDFSGGRTYVVRFDQDVKTNEIRTALTKAFNNDMPEVKTYGPDRQVKITTKYLIEEESTTIDAEIMTKLYEGLKPFFKSSVSYELFKSEEEGKLIGVLSSQMVGPTIADDIKKASILAVGIALLIIFIYIAIRFRKWQFGVGGISALIHDTLITVSMYSIFYNILPFTLELDQAFIAAILTIIGYSINDTVIIFDRIREFTGLYPKRTYKENVNAALNSTLARTFNTSGTTLVVLLTIFIFGGEVIRGFTFALLVGVAVGTYSSLFNASPVAFDLIMSGKKKQEKKLAGKRK
ncbi:protein translocase subunit SecDF [candidate division KSB1 bacterium]